MDLPPEIISEIFIQCLPWMSSPWTWSYPFKTQIAFDPCDAPFLLTRVCRQWRLIAEATPILWTRLPMTRIPMARSTINLALYKMYVKNSGEVPLWAHLTPGDAGQKVVDILITQLHRLEHLTLTFSDSLGPEPASVANSGLPAYLPSLKHLVLEQIYPSLYEEVDIYRLPKLIAPLLRSVSISSSKVAQFKIPWSQLTHYSGEFDDLDGAREFLSRCTNLEVLHLHNPRQSVLTVIPVPPSIHLPRLRDLSLVPVNTQAGLNDYHPLIDSLVLPALETARIGVDWNYPIVESLCRCVARSSLGEVSHLRSVEIWCSQMRFLSQQHLQELSLVAPRIQELRITRPSSEALFAMRFDPTNPRLFPCLQHLTLIEPLLKGHEVADILLSRCYPPDLDSCIRLRSVEVMFVEPSPKNLPRRRRRKTVATPVVSRCGIAQPLHEEFQDMVECFTDDPRFKQVCEELESILTVRKIRTRSHEYQLPSHWGKTVDPLQCFFEFSDAVFTSLENYQVHHPLLLSRHQAARLLREFVRGNLGSDGLLRAHRPEFLNRASALISQWQPMIEEYSKQEKWAIESVEANSLVPLARVYTHKVVYRASG